MNEVNALYDAVDKKDASKIATHFGHKRIPSAGLDGPLGASSSPAATEWLKRIAMTMDPRDMQVILLSPTAFDTPWEAIYQWIQAVLSNHNRSINHHHAAVPHPAPQNILHSFVMSIQAFFQQVEGEWSTGRRKSSQSLSQANVQVKLSEPPKLWLKRIAQAILTPFQSITPDDSPSVIKQQQQQQNVRHILPIVSTVCSLVKTRDDDLYNTLVHDILSCRPMGHASLVAWFQCLVQPHIMNNLDPLDQWVQLIQVFHLSIIHDKTAIPERSDDDDDDDNHQVARCVMALFRAAGQSPTIAIRSSLRQDRIWHTLLFRLLEREFTMEQNKRKMAGLERLLESSWALVPGDILRKWIRWSLQCESHNRIIPMTMATMILQAWIFQKLGESSSSTEVNNIMGPIFWEELNTFVFGRTFKEADSLMGMEAVTFVEQLLMEGERKQGDTIHLDDNRWVEDGISLLSNFVLLGIQSNDQTRLLVDTAFDTLSCYFESISGTDLLLFVILIREMFSIRMESRRIILDRIHRCFIPQEEHVGFVKAICIILEYIIESNHHGIEMWRQLIPILRSDISKEAFCGLVKALVPLPQAQHEMDRLSREWILQPTPSSYRDNTSRQESVMTSFQRGLHLLRELCLRGILEVKRKSVNLLGELLSSEDLVQFSNTYREQIFEAALILVQDGRIDPFTVESIFRHASRALYEKCERYSSQVSSNSLQKLPVAELQMIVLLSKLLSHVLSKAKRYSDSELLVECMWPFEIFLDSLFHGIMEWKDLKRIPVDPGWLDVSNNDVYIARAISSLSWTFQIALDGSPFLEVKGKPSFEALLGPDSSNECARPATSIPFHDLSLSTHGLTAESLIQSLRTEIANLALREQVWSDKPSADYKSFLMGVAYLLPLKEKQEMSQRTTISNDAFISLLDSSLLSIGFNAFFASKMAIEDMDTILGICLEVCQRVKSLESSQVNEKIIVNVLALYKNLCSEENFSDFFLLLEFCLGQKGKWKEDDSLVLSLKRRSAMESSVRRFQVEVLRALEYFLGMLSICRPSIVGRQGRAHVRALVSLLCTDLKIGLHSGSIDADLCTAFLNCTESACSVLMPPFDEFHFEDSFQILKTCLDTITFLEGILQSINLENAEIVEALLSLTTSTLPAVASGVSKHWDIKGESMGQETRESMTRIRDSLFVQCLYYNQKRLNPQGELQLYKTPSKINKLENNVTGTLKVSSLTSHTQSNTLVSDSILLPRLMSLCESDKTWDWVLKSLFDSYREALSFSEMDMHAFRILFCKEESRQFYFRWHGTEMTTILRHILGVFGQGSNAQSKRTASSFAAITLSSSVKWSLCLLLEQFCITLSVAIGQLKSYLCHNTVVTACLALVESLCFVVAWLSLDYDICCMIQQWLEWENRIASRAKSTKNVAVVLDASLIKELAKVADQIDDIARDVKLLLEAMLQGQEVSLYNGERSNWGEMLAFVQERCGASFDLVARLQSFDDSLATRRRQVSVNQNNPAVKLTTNTTTTTSKTKTAPTVTANQPRKKRKQASEPVRRNRNSLVEEWLHKDKETDNGKLGVDNYADLEDFLVED